MTATFVRAILKLEKSSFYRFCLLFSQTSTTYIFLITDHRCKLIMGTWVNQMTIFLKASQGQMTAAKFSNDLVNFLLLKTVFFSSLFHFLFLLAMFHVKKLPSLSWLSFPLFFVDLWLMLTHTHTRSHKHIHSVLHTHLHFYQIFTKAQPNDEPAAQPAQCSVA